MALRDEAPMLYEAVRSNGCDGISQLDASLVIVQNPGLGRYLGSDWGLRNLLNDPRVRIDKVKVATVFSTLFPTLCLFPQCPRSCRAAARSSVRRCGIRMQSVHFLAGNLQVEKEKLIPQ